MLKLLVATILFAVLCVNLSSCSSEDETSNNLPQIGQQTFTGKRLSQVLKDVDRGWYYEYIYENGLLRRCTEYYGGSINDGYNYELTYNDKTVTISHYSDVTTFYLDDNNFAISCSGKHNYTFEYNENGQLIAYGNWRLDYDGAGNVVKSYPYDSSLSNKRETTIEYSDNVNINGLLLLSILTVYDRDYGVNGFDDYDVLEVAYYAGILGMPVMNNVPSSYTEYNTKNNLRAEYDNQGNITYFSHGSQTYIYTDLY